jgi:hypothetical protein
MGRSGGTRSARDLRWRARLPPEWRSGPRPTLGRAAGSGVAGRRRRRQEARGRRCAVASLLYTHYRTSTVVHTDRPCQAPSLLGRVRAPRPRDEAGLDAWHPRSDRGGEPARLASASGPVRGLPAEPGGVQARTPVTDRSRSDPLRAVAATAGAGVPLHHRAVVARRERAPRQEKACDALVAARDLAHWRGLLLHPRLPARHRAPGRRRPRAARHVRPRPRHPDRRPPDLYPGRPPLLRRPGVDRDAGEPAPRLDRQDSRADPARVRGHGLRHHHDAVGRGRRQARDRGSVPPPGPRRRAGRRHAATPRPCPL